MKLKSFPSLTLLIFIFLFAIVILIFIWILYDLPNIHTINESLTKSSILITDRSGQLLYEIIDPNLGRYSPVPLGLIPEPLKKATIATEDQNFYSNPGIDLIGIVRALWININGGETLSGGSTITQQVVKNLLLSNDEQFERTFRRKIREAILAIQITSTLSKDEILTIYLNRIYYGGFAYGVEAASNTFFGKSVQELDIAECALIAGLPQGPSIYNPFLYPDDAKKRQEVVLFLMYKYGYLTKDQYELAVREPLNYISTPYPIEAPHFTMMVSASLDKFISPEILFSGPSLIVRTTLDINLQHLAESSITKHLSNLEDTDEWNPSFTVFQKPSLQAGHNVNNAALVALNPDNGEILALVGSPDYFEPTISGAINMAIIPRQPGSSLKPILYASAFDPTRSSPFTAATMILDVKTSFNIAHGSPYSPSNYDNSEHGPVSARQALASSLNIPAVKTLDYIGIPDFINLGHKLGISTFNDPSEYDLSLALGGGEVTLLDLTTAYSVFANNGFKVIPFSILDISTQDGQVIYTHKNPSPTQVIDQRVAWLISDILQDNEARSLGFSKNSTLKIDRTASVKTGTTSNFHDNWTIGYTPDLVVGVWVGNANHEPMRGVSGLSGAAPIWHQFIREALTGISEEWFVLPDGLTQIEVCTLSGLLPSHECPFTKYEWFIKGTEPKEIDGIFHEIFVDTRTGQLAMGTTQENYLTQILVLDLPPDAQTWAHKENIPLLSDYPLPKTELENYKSENAFQILSPADGSKYQIDPSIEITGQQLHFEVAYELLPESVTFWLDDISIAVDSQPIFETWWTLSPGNHKLIAECRLQSGESIFTQPVFFTVNINE